MVECKTWSMIPLENSSHTRSGSHTKIAAVINTPLEAQGAGFALEQGVDALVISSEPAMLEAALSVKAQRLERHEPTNRSKRSVEPTARTTVGQSLNKQALATGIAWIFSHRFRKARESSSAQVHAPSFSFTAKPSPPRLCQRVRSESMLVHLIPT